jgi:hypothetical protein
MKLQFGTAQAVNVLSALAASLPARAKEISALVGKCRLGLELTLTPIKPKHTPEQQGYYWMSLHAFGEWCGYDKGDVDTKLHPLICCKAYGVKRFVEINWDGELVRWPVPRATSSHDELGNKRDRESYSDLIEALIRFAADQGYIVAPPATH